MQIVLLLIYHGQGHLNACFKPAKILQTKYTVIFAGHPHFENHVRLQGFNFAPLQSVPFGLGFEPWVNSITGKKFVWWHALKDRWNDILYCEREIELKKLLNKIKPDYILIDSWQSTDFIVLYPLLKERSIKAGFIQTMLSTIIDPTLPPLNSTALPGDCMSIKLAFRRHHFRKFKKRIKEKIKYIFRENDWLIKRRIKINNILHQYISEHDSLFAPTFNLVDEFILSPHEFEFSNHQPKIHQHYVGFHPDPERKAKRFFTDNFIEDLLKNANQSSTLIYCSFGSVNYHDVTNVINFLHQLIKAISSSAFTTIISCNNKIVLEQFKNAPVNVHLFENVPQLLILKYAKVFISHGGLNSIKEAIHSSVPLLVYPVSDDVDQNGNGSRILYHKLGLLGNLINDKQDDILDKIKALLFDPTYVENLNSFKKIDSGYTGENFLTLIERLKSLD
jgi:hypothetical protein